MATETKIEDLLCRKRHCVYIAFDLLYLNGKDLRTLPLIERKAALKNLLKTEAFTNPIPRPLINPIRIRV